MKLSKQILEAINRGINLALDDFDDETIISQKVSQIEDKSSTKEYLWLKENFVDLGLPSGTLWAKYNLGVDVNKLNKAYRWDGNKYMWAVTKPHHYMKTADAAHYKWFKKKGFKNYITKYCYNEEEGIVDDLCTILSEDDAAAVAIGQKCRIPTLEDFEELEKYTQIKQREGSYNGIFDLSGITLVSKINGNEIFFPTSNNCQAYWTSTLQVVTPSCAYAYSFGKTWMTTPHIHTFTRYTPLFIRPIRTNN